MREKHSHESDEFVRFVAISATPTAITTREVEEASEKDPELIEVRKAIESWHFKKCMPYAAIANELCTISYLVLHGTRIVLLCIVGMKQHLRTNVWWPGMDRAAERHCKSYHGCQIVSRPDAPEPLPLPDGPWQDLAVDLLRPLPSKHSILVMVNYYSRFYENGILTSTTTSNMIDSLKGIFSRHGLPTTLKSDIGPQFRSDEGNGIKHLKTTPKWAQANGKVECQNASIMKRIRIVQLEGLDWQSNSGSMLQCTEESCITQQIKARLNFCSKGIWEARYLNSNLWIQISKFIQITTSGWGDHR